MTAFVHSPDIAERRIPMRDPRVASAALTDRRTVHLFQGERRPVRQGQARDVCVVCGYGEAGHSLLTQPERDLMVGLLNQPQPPPLMRRRILPKLMPARFRDEQRQTEPPSADGARDSSGSSNTNRPKRAASRSRSPNRDRSEA